MQSAAAEALKLLRKSLDNPRIGSDTRRTIRTFLNGDRQQALTQTLQLYKTEFESINPKELLKMPVWEEPQKRPNKQTLTLMMQALGPLDALTLETKTRLRCLFDTEPVVTPMKPRFLEARRGGLPRRLLNGHWMWQGGHWSIKNKNKMGSGYESNMFDRVGAQ